MFDNWVYETTYAKTESNGSQLKATKEQIKLAIEYLFQVKVTAVNTYHAPIKKKRIGKYIGQKTKYKRAIITLESGSSIDLFSEN